MKILLGFICTLVLTIFATSSAEAQVYYLGNSTPVVVTNVLITTTCGPLGPFNLGPNTVTAVPIPVGCNVTGIIYQGTPYLIGYSGAVPPPNPPNNLFVTIGRAVFTL